jgi:hypothetical protein
MKTASKRLRPINQHLLQILQSRDTVSQDITFLPLVPVLLLITVSPKFLPSLIKLWWCEGMSGQLIVLIGDLWNVVLLRQAGTVTQETWAKVDLARPLFPGVMIGQLVYVEINGLDVLG